MKVLTHVNATVYERKKIGVPHPSQSHRDGWEREAARRDGHFRVVDRFFDAFTKAVVIGFALYLAMEVIYAFSSGAVERLVR